MIPISTHYSRSHYQSGRHGWLAEAVEHSMTTELAERHWEKNDIELI